MSDTKASDSKQEAKPVDVKSFLDNLKQLVDKDSVIIFVPSVGKNVTFKPFSVRQHKDVIKTMLNGVEGSISVTKVFNDIIKENSSEDISFKHYDRNKILVELRRQSVGDKITIGENKYILSSLPKTKFVFDDIRSFEYSGIKVKTRIPSLDVDSRITEKSVAEINRFNTDDKKISNSVNILVAYEIIKFIDTIQIGDNTINFDEQSIYDKKNIVDNLPLKLNNIILDYIAEYKEYEAGLYTFDDGIKLTVDASFLTSE
jgi:hypothetical protein